MVIPVCFRCVFHWQISASRSTYKAFIIKITVLTTITPFFPHSLTRFIRFVFSLNVLFINAIAKHKCRYLLFAFALHFWEDGRGSSSENVFQRVFSCTYNYKKHTRFMGYIHICSTTAGTEKRIWVAFFFLWVMALRKETMNEEQCNVSVCIAWDVSKERIWALQLFRLLVFSSALHRLLLTTEFTAHDYYGAL